MTIFYGKSITKSKFSDLNVKKFIYVQRKGHLQFLSTHF